MIQIEHLTKELQIARQLQISMVPLQRPLFGHRNDLDICGFMEPAFAAVMTPWLEQASRSLAMAIVSATAILDLDAAVIDGSLSRSLINALIEATSARLAGYNFEGLNRPGIVAGQAGAHARALGASLLPLHKQFFPLKDIFLKQDLV